jgi:hypothetical protein
MSWNESLSECTRIERELLATDLRLNTRLAGIAEVVSRPEIMLPAGFSLGGLLGGLPPPRAYAVLRRLSRGYPFMTTALRFFTQ